VVHLENYVNAWVEGEFATTMRNSAILVAGTVSAILLLGGMAAYSLARLKPPGSDAFMAFMLVGATVPIWLYMVPLFFLFKSISLTETLHGLIIIYTAVNAPFSIFLLRSFMVKIPADYEDAARIDGANEWQIFFRVILPLAWPGFLTVGLVVALAVWSEFSIALVFVHKKELMPLTTSFFNFTERFSRDWTLTSAGAILMIVPVIIIFLIFQRPFVEGLTQGGLKG
jgi:raffinose/stachyose/melibiose transport system permease protein